MMSKRDEGQGRGLPVGWGWRDIDGPKGPGVESLYLYGPGVVEAQNFNGAAYNDGSWDAYTGPRRTADVDGKMMPPDSPRSPALLAAAQREAEAALWRVDGFGVGEVRGLVLGDEWAMPVGFALDTTKPSPMALPGLPGLWTLTRVSSARPITVDAARAPVAEPAPRFDDMKPREPGCLCHQEEGDSPCPVHPSEDDADPAPAYPGAPSDAELGEIADAAFGPIAEPAPRPATVETRQVWGWCNVYPEEHVDVAEPPPHPLAASLAAVEDGYAAPREPPAPARGPSCLSRGGSIKGWIGTPPPGWTPGMTPPCLACGAQAGKPCANPDDFEPQHFGVDGRGDERAPPAPTDDCARCANERAILCESCKGEGCGACDGDGDSPCPECNADGMLPGGEASQARPYGAEPAPTDDPARLLADHPDFDSRAFCDDGSNQ